MSPSAPRIICKAGPNLSSLKPLTVNGDALAISTDEFEGAVAVRIQNYSGPSGQANQSSPESDFSGEGDTWSVQLEGRFKKEVEVDQVLFGNTWENPIRDHLPYGTAAVLQFGRVLDPALTHDLYADQPYVLSPLLATMNYASITTSTPDSSFIPTIPGPVAEDVTPLLPSHPELESSPDKRKAFLGNAKNRTGLKLTPEHVVKADFANGFIDFNALALKLPIGLSFPLAKYWDGQPVSFVCRSRDGSTTYLIVTFTLEQEAATPAKEEDDSAEKKEHEVSEAKPENEGGDNVDELGVD